MASPDCVPEVVPVAAVRPVTRTAVPVCDPLKPVKSSAQNDLDSNLAKPSGAYKTLTMASKFGDLVVPANVHIRFYNCTFDNFDATQGNNIFYFEQCVFRETPTMTDVAAIASGTTFTKGARITRTKIELIPHEAPNTDPSTQGDSPTTKAPCVINDVFWCGDHSLLKSSESTFEWLGDSFSEIPDDMIRNMGVIREAMQICSEVTGAVYGVVSWANRAIVSLSGFSKLESMLDKFLNIPFTILSMVEGCVAKMVNAAFGALDALLAPFFHCAESMTRLFDSISSLITNVKSLPDRIATLANRCYLKIMGTGTLLAKRAAFLLDIRSRVELQLNQRIMAINGTVAELQDSSKMLLRNCNIVTSPSSGNVLPMFRVHTNSFLDVSRVKFLTTASAPLFDVGSGGHIKVSAHKVESTAPENGLPLVSANSGKVEVEFKEVVSNNTLLSGVGSVFIYDKLGSVTLNSSSAFVGDFDNCVA